MSFKEIDRKTGAAISFILAVLVALLPNGMKLFLLRRMGAHIGRNCRIGFSIILAKNIEIGDDVYIGNLNLIWRLKSLTLGRGSRINTLNWITGARTGSFSLGQNSSVSVLHYVESSGDMSVGANSIIAGRSSQFFTHGIRPDNLDDVSPIAIGDWCYVGSAARFLPGSRLANHCFLGMGAVVTRRFDREYMLLGGCPAKEIKPLPEESVFFNRPNMPHPHHRADYADEMSRP